MNTCDKEPLCALDICNMALEKLGEKRIRAIDPRGNPAQRLCYMHYHPTRREVLCACAWKFATKKVTLRSLGGALIYPDYHPLPADALRVLECSKEDWTIRGRNIIAHEDEITVTYTADEEDCELFEPLFVEAFATRLAAKLCIPLTSSTTKRQELTEEASSFGR